MLFGANVWAFFLWLKVLLQVLKAIGIMTAQSVFFK